MVETTLRRFEPEIETRIGQLASVDEDVLLLGPTGTGKSTAARRIHDQSARRAKPFVPLDCGAIPGELAESMLFGHERGAFTHAHRKQVGLVTQANEGTLFLDEIGELSLPVQAKLLVLLQDHVYRPVGGIDLLSSRFRLIAATNRDLIEMCNQGRFRADLYHRINGLWLTLRPLRETPGLARRLAVEEVKRAGFSTEHGARVIAAVERLDRHAAAWPGNIRELVQFVRRCALGEEEQERRTLEEWGRWRTATDGERLTAVSPSVGPSLADRQRYAGLIHEVAAGRGRPATAFSRAGSLALASRLLEVFPDPLSLDDVRAAMDVKDPRTVKKSVDDLVRHGLVEESGAGIVASWPPATSTLLVLRDGRWTPAGPGTIPTVRRGDRVGVQVTSKHDATVGVMLVTHRPGSPPVPSVIAEPREMCASSPRTIGITLDGDGGMEQVLVHVSPPARRGGTFFEPMVDEGVMPDSAALERGRRWVLDKWHEGWLAEHLVFHLPG